MECYYKDDGFCSEDLWQCGTCKEWFCAHHWHETDKGFCVECVACERTRKSSNQDQFIGDVRS